MKKAFLSLCGVIIIVNLLAQNKSVDALIKDFTSTNWDIVLEAKQDLENLEGKSISKIIELLNNKSIKKLQNTGDLIYPGAERFYGHGLIIDYDIDKINIRAGWLLEDLTFENFGFSGVHLEDSRLVSFIKVNFSDYYTANKVRIEKSTPKVQKELIEKLSIDNANAWWKKNSKSWKRISALAQALTSNDAKRQAKALFYIRNGSSKCTGLTKDYYKKHLEKRIKELTRSKLKRVSEQAKLIILDSSFDWLKIKKN